MDISKNLDMLSCSSIYLCELSMNRCAGSLTSLCFKVPLMKHIYTWVEAMPVDKKDIIRAISNKESPVICPGGVQEVAFIDK